CNSNLLFHALVSHVLAYQYIPARLELQAVAAGIVGNGAGGRSLYQDGSKWQQVAVAVRNRTGYGSGETAERKQEDQDGNRYDKFHNDKEYGNEDKGRNITA